ncbi:hypothetical protein HQ533_03090 [Candidatus Woesearchaeota archaeon]|nr:hypothetical protein [Candidatus Woesearchaeota archaeon]
MEEALISLKTEIVNSFWKNKFIKIGQLVFPRKKYKSLKVLSLTNSRNIEEVKILIKDHLTSRAYLFAWCNDFIEALSLDAEAKFNEVLDAAKFEETFLSRTDHKVYACFPFHVLNIDFTSQAVESEDGRLEKELHSIEKVLLKQKETNGNNAWLMLFTTLIDNTPVNVDDIKINSDQYTISLWSGMTFSKQGSLNDSDDIKNILMEFFHKMKDKYGLQVDIDSFTKPINSHEVMSISIIVK